MWRGIFSYLCRYWGNSQILSTSFIYLLIHSFSTTYEDTDSMLRNRNRKLPTNSPKASFFWTIRICLIFKLTAFKNQHAAAAAAKSLQSCPTLRNPIDGSPPGSPVPRILQARTLEWVAISFSNEWKWKVKVKSLSRVRLLATSMDCGPPGSSVHGIFQARVLEWGAIASVWWVLHYSGENCVIN